MNRVLILTAICACCLGWVPWNAETDYRVAVETRLIGDEWANGYGYLVERTDIRQRIQLDAFRLLNDPNLRLFFDADVGSDLGPTPQSLELGLDDRRTVLNLYAFEINARDYFSKTHIRIGRHLIHDAIHNMDGIDGISIRSSHIPNVDLVIRGGVATRKKLVGDRSRPLSLRWDAPTRALVTPSEPVLKVEHGVTAEQHIMA